jgi:hypothetical protein
MAAYFLAEVMSRALRAPRLIGEVIRALMGGMTELLVTERQRLHFDESRKAIR